MFLKADLEKIKAEREISKVEIQQTKMLLSAAETELSSFKIAQTEIKESLQSQYADKIELSLTDASLQAVCSVANATVDCCLDENIKTATECATSLEIDSLGRLNKFIENPD